MTDQVLTGMLGVVGLLGLGLALFVSPWFLVVAGLGGEHVHNRRRVRPQPIHPE